MALDAWITEQVLSRLEARSPANHRRPWDQASTRRVIDALDDQVKHLHELNRRYFVTADLTYGEWVRARDNLVLATDQQMGQAQRLLRPVGFPSSRDLSESRMLWPELSMLVRRGVIASELQRLDVEPAPVTNGVWYPQRLRPTWRLPDPPGWRPPAERARRLRGDWRTATVGRSPRRLSVIPPNCARSTGR